MPLLSVETFWQLLDHSIDLIKSQKQSKADLFNNVIDPLFIELRPVVDDYFALFRRTKQKVINSNRENLWEAIAEVRENREALLQSRIKVREMAKIVSATYHDSKISSFANKILEFFYGTEIRSKPDISGGEVLVQEFTSYVMGSNVTKEQLLTFIDKSLNLFETRWVAICQNYATLRVYCLSSTSININSTSQKKNAPIPKTVKPPLHKYFWVFLASATINLLYFSSSRIILNIVGTATTNIVILNLFFFLVLLLVASLTLKYLNGKWQGKKVHHLTFDFVVIITGISILILANFIILLAKIIIALSTLELWLSVIILLLPLIFPFTLLTILYNFSINLYNLNPNTANLTIILAQLFGAIITTSLLIPFLGVSKSLLIIGSIFIGIGIYRLWKSVQKIEQQHSA
jgi:hypothetical protein